MKLLAFLGRHWEAVAGAIVGLVIFGLYTAWQGEARRADALADDLWGAEAELLAANRRTASLERAAAERAVDTAEFATHDKEISDAIAKAAVPGTAPGPASLVLGCDRLRRQGSTASAEYRRLCGGR